MGDGDNPYAPPPEGRKGEEHPFGPRQPSYGTPGTAAPPPRPRPEPPRTAQQDARRATWWGAGALLACLFGSSLGAVVGPVLYLAAVVAGGIAVALGARALARAGGASVPGAIGAIVAGLIAMLIGLALAVYGLVFFTELREHERCLARANTTIARDDCMEQRDDPLGRSARQN